MFVGGMYIVLFSTHLSRLPRKQLRVGDLRSGVSEMAGSLGVGRWGAGDSSACGMLYLKTFKYRLLAGSRPNSQGESQASLVHIFHLQTEPTSNRAMFGAGL